MLLIHFGYPLRYWALLSCSFQDLKYDLSPDRLSILEASARP